MTPLNPSISPSAILHRRPAFAVNSPAVLCHQCYRIDDVAESESRLLSAIRRNIATIELNALLYGIQTAGLDEGDAAEIFIFALKPTGTEREAQSVQAVGKEGQAKRELDLKIGKFNAQVGARSASLRYVDSQRTILAMLPVLNRRTDIWRGWRARMRVDLHSEYYSITFILDRIRNQPDAAATTQEWSPASLPDRSDGSSQYVQTWYRNAWEDFFKLIEGETEKIGFAPTRFIDCRGLVLECPPSQAGPATRPVASHDPIVDLYRAQQQSEERKKGMFEWLNGHLDLMREILQFDRRYKHKDQDANCVLCTVLQGGGIYASSLGQIEPDRRAAEVRPRQAEGDTGSGEPDRYFILHDGMARFQLGRLLRRLHVLDELRCAAVFDFGDLISASENIRTLGNEIDSELHTEDAQQEKSGLTRKALADVQGQLNELTSTSLSCGLLYRINRSRYYARDFKQRMTDMLFERIDGWEPYDIFMHRNLYPILDHIDSIGQRFESLSLRVERLTDARNVEELVKVESEIAYIQSIGEIIGWTAFAYYFGQIVAKVVHPVCKFAQCLVPFDCAWLANHEAAEMVSIVFAGCLALFLGVGFRNRWFGKLFGPKRNVAGS